jgi:hypothetical protein
MNRELDLFMDLSSPHPDEAGTTQLAGELIALDLARVTARGRAGDGHQAASAIVNRFFPAISVSLSVCGIRFLPCPPVSASGELV